MSTSTTRRRLDFGRKRGPTLAPGSTLHAAASTTTTTRSLSSSSIPEANSEIVSSSAVKQCLDFYEFASVPEEQKTAQEVRDESHAIDVRNVVAQGPTKVNGAEYAALVKETLARRVEDQLKADEWMFGGVGQEFRTADG